MSVTKVCKRCNTEKRVSEFHKDAQGRGGLHANCKPCSYARNSAWDKANPDKLKKRRWRWQSVSRAKSYGCVVEYFNYQSTIWRLEYYGYKCWVCGVEADQIDHVKPLSKGGAHMLCNIRPICARCNQAKRAWWPLSCKIQTN
jgi:hypothetical protein